MSVHLARRALAELIGTALLVLFGSGSVVAAVALGGRVDYSGLGMIALCFGLVVAIVIYGFGTTSGAHINPAVSISLAAVRRFPWRDVPAYVAAQLVGAVLGGLLVVAVFGTRATRLGGIGLTALSPSTGYLRGVVAEALGTFLLLFTIMALAVDRPAPAGWAGLIIGLAVTANSLFGGATPWHEIGVYVLGPLIGGVVATLGYDAVARPARAIPVETPQGTQGEVEGRQLSEPDQDR